MFYHMFLVFPSLRSHFAINAPMKDGPYHDGVLKHLIEREQEKMAVNELSHESNGTAIKSLSMTKQCAIHVVYECLVFCHNSELYALAYAEWGRVKFAHIFVFRKAIRNDKTEIKVGIRGKLPVQNFTAYLHEINECLIYNMHAYDI